MTYDSQTILITHESRLKNHIIKITRDKTVILLIHYKPIKN